MAQILKYVIGKDYRPLTVLEAKGGNTFTPDYDKSNWVQARQYEDSLRQVFVEITNEDGSAYDLTGANVLFEGILPDNEHKILDNSHVVFYEDPTTGKFRFDMPAQAFSVAGQYKQAFFRVVKDYRNIATLEFKFEVLADMVITGLVPRDYISPLEDLFNTIKEAETKNVAELKKIIDDKVNEITNLMTTLNQTNTATLAELNNAKTSLEALQEKITQSGLFTKAEADELKKEIVSDMQSTANDTVDKINNSFSKVGNNFPANETNLINLEGNTTSITSIVDATEHSDNILNIGMITDAHIEPSDWYSRGGINHYRIFGFISKLAGVDLIVSNGDNVDGSIGTQNTDVISSSKAKDIIINEHKYAIEVLSGAKGSNIPMFFNRGNHDSGARKKSNSGSTNSLSNEELANLYNTNGAYGEIRGYDNLCWYLDFADKKVRVIGLNSEDLSDATDSSGIWSENDIDNHKFSQAQLTWLANVALKVPADYSIVMFWHTPLDGAFGATNGLVNSDVLKAILINFKNSTSQSITNSDNSVNINVDFTGNSNNKIIAIFNGHYHRDAIDTATIPGITMVETDKAGCFWDFWNNRNEDSSRKYGTSTETVFDIISIDLSNKQINMYRYGAGDNRSINYN